MSSSIEEQFQPPEWATKEEVIKAACHYINYWKIEARQRNQQWLDALQGESNAKRCETSLRGELSRKNQELAILRSAREQDVAEVHRLKAEVERLRASSFVTAVPVEQYERLVKAGDIIARIIAPPAHGPGEWDGEWYAWHNAKSGVLSDETPPNTPPTAL